MDLIIFHHMYDNILNNLYNGHKFRLFLVLVFFYYDLYFPVIKSFLLYFLVIKNLAYNYLFLGLIKNGPLLFLKMISFFFHQKLHGHYLLLYQINFSRLYLVYFQIYHYIHPLKHHIILAPNHLGLFFHQNHC